MQLLISVKDFAFRGLHMPFLRGLTSFAFPEGFFGFHSNQQLEPSKI
ncbi:hypothetical protein HP456_06540 [Bacillus haikouensis]|nr:hypothetical protein [Bacillus haikouensis]NQD65579.1 hypothetical protein [Bacillus haikouensis]